MRITGLFILLIGLAAGVFTGIAALSSKPAVTEKVGTAAAEPTASPPGILIPAIVAAAGLAVGSGLLMFGSRGYSKQPNPAVRN